MQELVEEHRRLVARRGEIIKARSELHVELIEIDVALDKLNGKIEKALKRMEQQAAVEFIELDEPPKF